MAVKSGSTGCELIEAVERQWRDALCAKDMDRLFRPFSRVRSRRTAEIEGSGLGLYNSRPTSQALSRTLRETPLPVSA